MSQQLPKSIAVQISSRLEVEWWGRRARFEYVEEVSEATSRVLITLWAGAAMWPDSLFGNEVSPVGYWIIVSLLCLFVSRKAIEEVYNWRNEVYVVCRDAQNGNGRVYKFWGWLRRRRIEEPITLSSPTKFSEDPSFAYRVWGWLTGERMEKVVLRSANHTFLDGQKMHPKFLRAIGEVAGSRPGGDELKGVLDMQTIKVIQQALYAGLIDEKLARGASETLVRKAIY